MGLKTKKLEATFIKHLYKNTRIIGVRFRRWLGYEADVIGITNSDYFYEYELKTSRADFFNDKAKDKHRILLDPTITQKPNYFYYVIPEGLVKEFEIPEHAGLIYVGDNIEIIKKAPRLHKEKVSYEFMKEIAKNLTDRALAEDSYSRRIYPPSPQTAPIPNWICGECANKNGWQPTKDYETFHAGTCGICGNKKIVAPSRYYGFAA